MSSTGGIHHGFVGVTSPKVHPPNMAGFQGPAGHPNRAASAAAQATFRCKALALADEVVYTGGVQRAVESRSLVRGAGLEVGEAPPAVHQLWQWAYHGEIFRERSLFTSKLVIDGELIGADGGHSELQSGW